MAETKISKQKASELAQKMVESFIGETQDKEITTFTEFSSGTKKIIIPETMSKLEASLELKKQHEEEETTYDAIKIFEEWHYKDTLVAIKKATERTFGWMHGVSKSSFFGKSNPKEIQVQTNLINGVVVEEQCFLGSFVISPWDEADGDVGVSNGFGYIKLEVKKKFRKKVDEYFSEITKILQEESIYKGKSLKYTDGEFQFIEPMVNPHIVLNREEELVIDNFIIKKLGRFKKQTVLFTGPYGTGKTESAMRIGTEAVKKNITFVYCKNPNDFSKLLVTMRNYLPGIIFLEDIESVGGGEKRDGKMNDLLNTLDGVETKGAQLLTIFTTNHEKRINKALRRPGRIDIIVSFAFCTEDTIQKIMQAKFKGVQGADSLDYEYLSKVCPKVQGAVIAAICDRALDLAEYTNGGEITNEIVESSKVSMQYQIDFMAEDPEIIESPAERVYGTLMQGIRENIADLI
jgi:hypothetical protein